MGTKKNSKVFTRASKKVKGVPKFVLVDQKVTSEEEANQKIADLQKKNEVYIEVVNETTKIKTVFTKPLGAKNYIKKDFKL